MKNALTLTIIFCLLFAATLGCKTGALSKFRTAKSKCAKNLPALDSSEKYAARGMEASNEGDYECSLDDCEKALELDGKNGEALVCRGYVSMKREEYDAAESDFDAAVKMMPENPLALHQRSQLYRHKKQFGKALTDMNRVIELMPADFYYARRGAIYADSNDYENALKDYTEAIRQKPETAYYYSERAELYRKTGKTDLAEADERKSEELASADERDAKNSEPKTINDQAVSLPKPVYPPAARAVKASGDVKVEIEVDAKGNVTSAKAVSGHPLLQAAAVAAARQAKFKLSSIGKGILVFNFAAHN